MGAKGLRQPDGGSALAFAQRGGSDPREHTHIEK